MTFALQGGLAMRLSSLISLTSMRNWCDRLSTQRPSSPRKRGPRNLRWFHRKPNGSAAGVLGPGSPLCSGRDDTCGVSVLGRKHWSPWYGTLRFAKHKDCHPRASGDPGTFIFATGNQTAAPREPWVPALRYAPAGMTLLG